MSFFKNRLLDIILLVLLIIFLLSYYFLFKNDTIAKENNRINEFPDSYKPYLEELSKNHPNWEFIPLYTNLDWNYVISEENKFGKNLVPINYSDNWKNKTPGQYNVEIDAGWVDSSKEAVMYLMDPRNFLNEVRIFQFEELSYNSSTNNIKGIEKILYGTEFYNKKVSYLNSSGESILTSSKYSDLILKASKTSYVSSYHIASRIKQEVGPFLSHKSISGDVSGYKGLYNFYNIGATSSSEPLGAIKNGLRYARDGNGASESTKKKYLIPWNTKEKSITGGAIFIGSSYINKGQNTIYLQKFDVYDKTGDGLFWHQYMTNVLAPYSESKSIYNGYSKMGMLDNSLSFIIPIYNNMPDIMQESPSINQKDFVSDNTKVYSTGNNVNIRTGPSTSYEIITKVNLNEKMTRIKKGKQSNDKWDKVILENGIIGYISSNYVDIYKQPEIEKIEINFIDKVILKGEKKKLNIKIYPEEAKNNKVSYTSSNPEIITVDDEGYMQAIRSGKSKIIVKSNENNVSSEIDLEVYSKVTDISLDQSKIYLTKDNTFKINAFIAPDDANNKNIIYESLNNDIAKVDTLGNITGVNIGETTIIAKSEENPNIRKEVLVIVVRKLEDNEIEFLKPLKTDGFEISGVNFRENTIFEIKQLIKTNLELEFLNNKGEVLDENEKIGTGSIIKVKEDDKLLREYKIILYGDITGDGKINSTDLLVLQRYILELDKLDDIYLKAGNINKNGKKPTSVDLLLIQRHILGLKYIEQ